MLWWLLAPMLSFLLDLAAGRRQSVQEKDARILLLRHQIRVLERRLPHPPRPSSWERLVLVVLAAKLRDLAQHGKTPWRQGILLFKPDPSLRWHREVVRRQWTFAQRRVAGRPPLGAEMENLIVQLACENPRWGYSRLKRSGVISTIAVRGIPPRDELRRPVATNHQLYYTKKRALCQLDRASSPVAGKEPPSPPAKEPYPRMPGYPIAELEFAVTSP